MLLLPLLLPVYYTHSPNNFAVQKNKAMYGMHRADKPSDSGDTEIMTSDSNESTNYAGDGSKSPSRPPYTHSPLPAPSAHSVAASPHATLFNHHSMTHSV